MNEKIPLEIKKTHPHDKECESFNEALKFGHIIIIEDEPQIPGKLPKDAKAGNILTGEVYDPQNFILNMVINFCPFCGKQIFEKEESL